MATQFALRKLVQSRMRGLLEGIAQATRVLPWLGFGRTAPPPTEPVTEQQTQVAEMPEPAAPHEQRHVPPTEHQDPRGDHPR